MLGVFTGVTPIGDYGSLRNLIRVLGVGGLATVAGTAIGEKLRRSPHRACFSDAYTRHQQSPADVNE